MSTANSIDWLGILEPVLAGGKKGPMYVRITQRLRAAIEAGELLEDQRLPADRELSRLLSVDRSTVARAYDQLEAEGLLYSHVGRGTFVRRREPPVLADRTSGSDQIVWSDKFSQASHDIAGIARRQPVTSSSGETISFAAGSPTDEFFPSREFQQIVVDTAASADAGEMFGYSQPEGHPALRRQVLQYLSDQGIEASDEELLIVSGSQQGIDLVARTLINQGDAVLMEDPTYFWAICTFTANGARCLPVPALQDGLRLDILENMAGRLSPKLLYCMPSFQNPTGATLALEKRKRLLELARKYQVPVLEDNFVGDLCYEDKPLPSLFTLDRLHGTVIYQGTFSKALCPGLRLGWLVAPAQVMARLRLVKRTCDLSTNSMGQLILAEYLKRGLYQEHLKFVQEAYRKRLDAMCEALQQHAADWLAWQRPQGGMFIFAKLPPGYSSRELLPFAQREGVMFSPGDIYFVSANNNEYLRLNFIQQSAQRIEEGVRRLGRALKAYSESRKRNKALGGALLVSEATFM